MDGLWGAMIVAGVTLLWQVAIWAHQSGRMAQRQNHAARDIQRLERKIDNLCEEVNRHEAVLARICERLGIGADWSGNLGP